MEDLQASAVEPVTMTEVLELATWNQPRTSEYLREYRETRLAAIADLDEE